MSKRMSGTRAPITLDSKRQLSTVGHDGFNTKISLCRPDRPTATAALASRTAIAMIRDTNRMTGQIPI